MELMIGLIALVMLVTVVSFTYLSLRQVNKRLFNQAPLTPIAALRAGVPARISGTIETEHAPIVSPIHEHSAVRIHTEVTIFVPGNPREDYVYTAGIPAVIRDAQGGQIHVDFGGDDVRVRFIEVTPDERGIDMARPTIAELMRDLGIDRRHPKKQFTPLAKEVTVQVGAQVTIRGMPQLTADGHWELKPIHAELMVRFG